MKFFEEWDIWLAQNCLDFGSERITIRNFLKTFHQCQIGAIRILLDRSTNSNEISWGVGCLASNEPLDFGADSDRDPQPGFLIDFYHYKNFTGVGDWISYPP